LGPRYDRLGSLLSFGQDPRWRRFLVLQTDAGPHDTVLDVATGTAAVALELVRQKDCFVVGIDLSPEMLAVGRQQVLLAGATKKVRLQEGDARSLPFEDGLFDAVTFTYLLRYVDDRAAVIRELVRVLRPGGRIGMVEFGLPQRGPLRRLWWAWTRAGLPLLGRLASRAWYEAGRFLGPSIERLWREEPDIAALWRSCGIEEVEVARMSLGAGVVVWGRRR
ncbi:MAG TPA: class I SAM-dependent methyltransferase, partial [Solirubrobacteraceae bacterium]|nr:class I SAM-dependent methyltransferase [Solirubrobacteraceae bacterium]